MEQEIDLRSYIEILIRHWKLIVGLGLLAATLGLAYSLLQPATYEASSVVIVTEPRYQMQFDPRFETSQRFTPAYEAFPMLAASDEVLQQVVDTYSPSPEAGINDWRLAQLSGMTQASSGGDPSLLVLTVRSRSAEDAAAIANQWAAVVTQKGNEIYGESEKDVAFFEEQLAQAAGALDAAGAALIEFAARNQANTIGAQLESQQQAQIDYLDGQRTIAYIIQDIQGLRDQLAEQQGNQPVSLADNLTALLLQIKAFNAQATTPIELRIDSSESLSANSQAEQVAFLDTLVTTLRTKSDEIDTRLAELEPQILALQQKLEEINVAQDRLVRAQELASETHWTLARKLDEARIAAQEESGILQVGSYAAIPESQAGPQVLFTTAVAGLLGLVVGVIVSISIEFWPKGESQATGDADVGIRE